jgi:transketolase N-terminal domain/subunit
MEYFFGAISGLNILFVCTKDLDKIRANKTQKHREPIMVFICSKGHAVAKAAMQSWFFVSLQKRE